jgi:hypothetical protein
MIEKVEIGVIPNVSAANGGRATIPTTSLICKTMIGNSWVVLTKNWYLLPEVQLSDEKYKGEQIMEIPFSQANPRFQFEYETGTVPMDGPETASNLYRNRMDNELNKRKKDAVTEFFARHFQIEHRTELNNGHKATNPTFYLEITTRKSEISHQSDRKRMLVFNKVEQMTHQQQYDLALYYRPELFGKRRSELLQGLIGLKGIATDQALQGGILMREPYLTDFLANYEDNPMVSMKIYVNKAVRLGILSKSGDGIYFKGTFVGKDENAAVVYFTTDERMYGNQIVPEVNRLSNLPEDDTDPFQTVYEAEKLLYKVGMRDIREKNPDAQHAWTMLKAKAVALGIKSIDTHSYSALKKAVEDAEKDKREAAELAGLPTLQLAKDLKKANEIETSFKPEMDSEFKELIALAKELGLRKLEQYTNKGQLAVKIGNAMKQKEAAAKAKGQEWSIQDDFRAIIYKIRQGAFEAADAELAAEGFPDPKGAPADMTGPFYGRDRHFDPDKKNPDTEVSDEDEMMQEEVDENFETPTGTF